MGNEYVRTEEGDKGMKGTEERKYERNYSPHTLLYELFV
jgi:hypothetical protein